MRCLVFTVALTLVIPKIQREFNELIDIWQFSSDILLGINSHITLNCATIGGSISVQCHNVVETRRLLCYVTVKGGQYRVVILPVQKVFLPGQRQKVVKTWQKRLLPAKSGKN